MTDKQLTEVSDLLKPRYKVISDWPGRKDFEVGQIVTLDKDFSPQYKKFEITDCQGTRSYINSFFEMFPLQFKRLEWWEERMPEEVKQIGYAKTHAGNSVRMIESIDAIWGKITFVGGKVRNIRQWVPATEEEYESFINQNKQS